MISSLYKKIVGTSPPPEPDVPKILCVGVNCLDIVTVCKEFPLEDSEQRCLEQRWQRGGNASNTCTVLSLLGSSCEFLGSLSSDQHVIFLEDDMRKHKIDFSHCPIIDGVGCPMSTVILSIATGSRTILHFNPNLPELLLKDFEKLNLEDYSWIHFEGRNVSEVICMMQYVESYNNSLNTCQSDDSVKLETNRIPITISVELEKPKPELVDLLPYADVAFIARDFAHSKGFDNMSETLRNIGEEAKSGATIICAWSEWGAMGRTPDSMIVQSPSFPPNQIIDTLGAGDTFNAATLYYLNMVKTSFIKKREEEESHKTKETFEESSETDKKREIKQNTNIESTECSRTEFINANVLQGAINFACHVAGAKIGLRGYDGLEKILRDLYK
ncbi:ketohexokinase-like [Cephus cinctus]|uniref:Ketohexokinase-like n=1 Tax=Cephus cinctus TaxID=211228 RepID=A0AAJ7C636_CEPCN|nr:ketohexokinase-like [Cephus cinctus]